MDHEPGSADSFVSPPPPALGWAARWPARAQRWKLLCLRASSVVQCHLVASPIANTIAGSRQLTRWQLL